MYYVYVLKSHRDSLLYIGYTTDLKNRIYHHNEGLVLATKHRRPLKLIFYEAFISKDDAKRRENYLKTTKGKSTLKIMLKEYFSLKALIID
ncbi:MAG: GIY-YIG nuclease family protein [Candidatus Omnitrophica bacterium]|nr:GIY-YIG nuclease family protein [Candidatus Omnitrophota bacterium]